MNREFASQTWKNETTTQDKLKGLLDDDSDTPFPFEEL
jgi:hypothetical protein